MKKIRVLVIDDSALVRALLGEIIPADGDLEVVGSAPDPYVARERIKQMNPDVLTLDVEMPRMDGITFLRNLMRLRPMPVVMVSALTEKGAEETLRALELGAVDFVTKPRDDGGHTLRDYGEEIRTKIRVAAASRLHPAPSLDPLPRLSLPRGHRHRRHVIGIGASAGGTEAIRAVVAPLPPETPGILVCQHLPPLFSEAFVRSLDAATAMRVLMARDGAAIVPGHIYVSPGDRHLRVVHRRGEYICRLDTASPVNQNRPSVDALFLSLAEQAGAAALGVLLTGMGSVNP